MNEIVPGQQGTGLETQVESRVFRGENAINAEMRSRRLHRGLFDSQDIWVSTVTQLPVCRDWNMVRHQVFGFVPMHRAGNIEIAEIGAPGFYRVAGNHRVPVQRVDRKSRMVNCRRYLRETQILYLGIGTKYQAVVAHR